jgi:peptide chain release factor 1
MDLVKKLASLAERYEELNSLMAQPDVIDDIPLLQRYGREHAELEEVVQKYHEIQEVEQQLADAQEMYEGDDLEMRELAYEEIARLKDHKEHLLEKVQVALLPKDIMDEKNAIVTVQRTAA